MPRKAKLILRRALVLALMTLSLLLGCSERICEDWRVIVDNSGSLRQALSYLDRVGQTLGQDFAKQARSGSSLTVIRFAAKDQPYKHRVCYSRDLQIKVPAWQSRKEQAAKIGQELAVKMTKLPLVDISPILEVINFESSLIKKLTSKVWRLVLVSDLMQCSSGLILTPAYLKKHSDDEIVRQMLKICPPPECPPVSVVVYWYPGLYNKKTAIDPVQHKRIRGLFHQFFSIWAGRACKIEFIAVKEV